MEKLQENVFSCTLHKIYIFSSSENAQVLMMRLVLCVSIIANCAKMVLNTALLQFITVAIFLYKSTAKTHLKIPMQQK